jgi:hypothetical protein
MWIHGKQKVGCSDFPKMRGKENETTTSSINHIFCYILYFVHGFTCACWSNDLLYSEWLWPFMVFANALLVLCISVFRGEI